MDNYNVINEAYSHMVNEAKDITVKLTHTPKTSDNKTYEGTWKADAGVTDEQVRAEITKIIKKKINKVVLFDHMGQADKKPTPFRGSGTWIAK